MIRKLLLTFLFLVAFTISFSWFTSAYPMGEPIVEEGVFVGVMFTPWINVTAIEATHIKIKNMLGIVVVDTILEPYTYKAFEFYGVGYGSMLYVKSARAVIVHPVGANIIVDKCLKMDGDLFYDDDNYQKQLEDVLLPLIEEENKKKDVEI